MSIIDILIGFFTFGAVGRGYQMGFAHELERLMKVGLSFLASLGLFRYVREILVSITGLESGFSGFIGFIGSFAVVYWLIRKLQSKLHKAIEKRVRNKMKPAGALLGGAQALAAAIALLASFSLVDWSVTNKLFLKNSKVAALAADLVGKDNQQSSGVAAPNKKVNQFKKIMKERATASDQVD